jgi:DNA polymerase III subunit beta
MLTCELKPLLAALKAAKRVTGSRQAFPILGFARVAGDTLTVTDLDMELSMPIAPQEPVPPFMLPVDAALKLFSGVKAGALVHITPGPSDDLLTVTAGDLSADLETLPEADFPRLTTVTDWHYSDHWPGDSLQRLLTAASGCMSDEETRYYLRGVNFCEESGSFVLVATDGHRLAHVATESAYAGPPVIMPAPAVKLALALGFTDARLALSEKRVQLSCDGFALTTKAVDGTFPDYTRILPKDLTGASTVGTAALKDAAARLSKLTNNATAVLDSGLGTLTASGTDNARRVSITLQMDHPTGEPAATTGYDPKYLTQLAGLIAPFDDLLTIQTPGETGNPSLLTPDAQPDGARLQFVLMPKRF